ncbi:MAG: Uncharacterised protein [Opitutia bacterium UBA7350]|nr:MAG: Uncharacterised protein [Opitutae bacterium UBA7350]
MQFKYQIFALLLLLQFVPAGADHVWPTPNEAFIQGESVDAFVQPTVSGKVESGLFGCVRNGGQKFHEGLDLFPVRRDAHGEANDQIFSIRPGRVVYICDRPSWSNYGRYVVVQHKNETTAFHSLYAHIAKIDPRIQVGVSVDAGTVLGVMGRSASGYVIPKSRAHLHFEIGLRLSHDFEAWYQRHDFRSPNRHGSWNGMNLVSVDPLGFYKALRQKEVTDFNGYLKALPVAARVRVFSNKIPQFIRDNPELNKAKDSTGKIVAWDIAFTDFGVPKEWTPRFQYEGLSGEIGEVSIISYALERLKKQTCHRVVNLEGSKPTLSKHTKTTLQLLFGFH